MPEAPENYTTVPCLVTPEIVDHVNAVSRAFGSLGEQMGFGDCIKAATLLYDNAYNCADPEGIVCVMEPDNRNVAFLFNLSARGVTSTAQRRGTAIDIHFPNSVYETMVGLLDVSGIHLIQDYLEHSLQFLARFCEVNDPSFGCKVINPQNGAQATRLYFPVTAPPQQMLC